MPKKLAIYLLAITLVIIICLSCVPEPPVISPIALPPKPLPPLDIPLPYKGACIDCHTSKVIMSAFIPEKEIQPAGCPPPPPIIISPKMKLVSQEFLQTTHGKLGCQTCHKGQSPGDVKSAHEGLIPVPSFDGGSCKQCHENIVSTYTTTLHYTKRGKVTALEARSFPGAVKKDKGLSEVWKADCGTCHASCGSCHVSRPKVAGGGLIQGHQFQKRAPMSQTCYACHGRIKAEYKGDFGQGDIHYFKAGKTCIDCHKKDNLHGVGITYAHRREVKEQPKCTNCHDKTQLAQRPVHATHFGKLSCYVCHSSGPIASCFNCHLGFKDGEKYRYAERLVHTFKIGLNPSPTPRYPYKYVVLRHVPITKDTFKYFGVVLPKFDEVVTWHMATPHNIQRITPQNRNCNSCHGQKELFLTEEDLIPGGSKANERVIVRQIPKKRE